MVFYFTLTHFTILEKATNPVLIVLFSTSQDIVPIDAFASISPQTIKMKRLLSGTLHALVRFIALVIVQLPKPRRKPAARFDN